MQCVLTTEALDSRGQSYLGGPLGPPNQVISSITEHPDLTDAWEAFVAGLEAIGAVVAAGLAGAGVSAAAVLSATISWASQEIQSGSDKKYGDAKRITIPAGAAYWLPNASAPIVDWGDQLRVRFRAWSEDEIKPGAETRVEESNGLSSIVDEGSGYHQTDGTYFWESSVLLPIRTLPVGVYTVSSKAVDDGWFFDVQVGAVLVIEVTQNPYPRRAGTPVTFVPPSSADTRALQTTLGAIAQLKRLAPNPRIASKRTSPRLDGRAPVLIDRAMAVPFVGQKLAPSPTDKTPTVLPEDRLVAVRA
jgi:hypothetical protein